MKKITGAALFLLSAAGLVFYSAGRCPKPLMTVEKGRPYRLAGKYLEKNLQGQQFDSLWRSMLHTKRREKWNGDLTVVSYSGEEQKHQRQFLGIQTQVSPEIVYPEDFELVYLKPDSVVSVQFRCGFWTEPTLNLAKQTAEKMLKNTSRRLQGPIIKQYFGDTLVAFDFSFIN
ncbi:MAG: hypothetical protein MI784_08065 [Cytophagales bacterium]|nr:hypothetical protein [Cytophagales bacterium]